MKLILTFKTPNVVSEAIENQCSQQIKALEVAELELKLAKWIDYGEYVTLEYDTETNTIEVREA